MKICFHFLNHASSPTFTNGAWAGAYSLQDSGKGVSTSCTEEHTVNNAIVIPSTMQSRAPCKDQVHTLLIPQKYPCRSKTLIKRICSPLLSNRTFFYSWCSFSRASDLIACFIFFFHWISSLHLSQTLRFSYVAQLLQCWLFFSFLTSLDSRKSKSLSHLLLQPFRRRVSNIWVRHWCSASLYWS